MLLKGILAIFTLLLILTLTPLVQAQNQGIVSVDSNPQGAEITLSGNVKVSGLTPATFSQLMIGQYKLEINRRGYEKYSQTVMIDPGRHFSISANLSKKTSIKAALRSMVIPGWGQRYFDKRAKGNFLTLLAASSVVAYLIADSDFDDKYDDYLLKLNKFDHLAIIGNIVELKQAEEELNTALNEAYDAENIRRTFIGSTIAIWGISILDALFFSPVEKGVVAVKGITIEPQADLKSVSITLSKAF